MQKNDREIATLRASSQPAWVLTDGPAAADAYVHPDMPSTADARVPSDPATVGVLAELDALKALVHLRRAAVAASTGRQLRSTHRVEAQALRIQAGIERRRKLRSTLFELELQLARAEMTLFVDRIELAQVAPRLAAGEHELARCATARALVRCKDPDGRMAQEFIESCRARQRRRLAPLTALADRLGALDLPVRDVREDDAPATADAARQTICATLRDAIGAWSAALDTLPDNRGAHPSTVLLQNLSREALPSHAALMHRVELLAGLAEIRVEEMQALHARTASHSIASFADIARLDCVRMRLRLEERERSWRYAALEAIEHEQAARLLGHADHGGEPIARTLSAWRACLARIEETAMQTSAARAKLGRLREALGVLGAEIDRDVRELGVRARGCRSALQSRRRDARCADSRLRRTRERLDRLDERLRRSRAGCEHVPACHTGTPAPLSGTLAVDAAIEGVFATLDGLARAHEESSFALACLEQALLALASRSRVRTPRERPESFKDPWAAARIELDIASIEEELERWKTRHARLEERVDAQERQLARVERRDGVAAWPPNERTAEACPARAG